MSGGGLKVRPIPQILFFDGALLPELVDADDGLFASDEYHLVFTAHDDRLFGTGIHTVTAEHAPQESDLVDGG